MFIIYDREITIVNYKITSTNSQSYFEIDFNCLQKPYDNNLKD